MPKYIVKNSTTNPIKIGAVVDFKSPSAGGSNRKGGSKPQPPKPRKSLDERITEAVAKGIAPVVQTLNRVIELNNLKH